MEKIGRIRARRALTGDRNQCPGCGQLFNSTGAFERHRVGDYGGSEGRQSNRRCLTIDEMLSKGMAKNRADFWCRALMAVETDGVGHRQYRAKMASDQQKADGDVRLIPA